MIYLHAYNVRYHKSIQLSICNAYGIITQNDVVHNHDTNKIRGIISRKQNILATSFRWILIWTINLSCWTFSNSFYCRVFFVTAKYSTVYYMTNTIIRLWLSPIKWILHPSWHSTAIESLWIEIPTCKPTKSSGKTFRTMQQNK